MKALSSTASAMRHTFGALFEALVIIAVIAALIFGYAALSGASPAGAGDTFAAKGGNGNGRGNGGQVVTTPAWVSATPGDAAAWGSRIDIEGCGYEFAPVEVRVVHSAGASEAFMVGVWSSGCMASTYFTTQEPGIYTIEVYQASGTNGHETNSLLASTTVSVS